MKHAKTVSTWKPPGTATGDTGCLVGETDENKATLLAKHVSRNTAQAPKLVRETFQMYEASHVPYITGIPSSAIGWVYKILNKEKEVERLLFDDPDPAHGFVLNVDPKWTSHAAMDVPKAEWHAKSGKNEMYMLGLCHTKEVRSLRDLRAVHLPMLRNMLAKGTEIASATYGVPFCFFISSIAHNKPQSLIRMDRNPMLQPRITSSNAKTT